jgi:zinc D-Ala-D-Ala carboxypeptidase
MRGVHHARPARATTHPIRIHRTRVAGLLAAIAIAATAAAVGAQWPAASSPTTAAPAAGLHGEPRVPGPPPGPLGEADGAVPDATTVFDDGVPAVAHLDPALLGALRHAATDAGDDGVGFVVNSGWRSAAYQEHLLQEAIARYGSREAAARWVATPATSDHVSGHAVDIGPSGAAAWLAQNGVRYGLCQTYGNEPWHFELRPEAIADGCPPTYADPTHDPRMRK